MLIKYVRDKNHRRIGVVVAIDKNRIGWSKCNFSMGDKFNKDRGKFIAKKRAEKYIYDETYRERSWKLKKGKDHMKTWIWYDFLDIHNIAQCVRPDFLEMAERARKYFKD